MRKWEYSCKCFQHVRTLIENNDESTSQCFKIMDALECCCDELAPDDREEWYFYDAFRDMKSEIHEEIEYMDESDYESCQNTVNNFLEEFYDLCDSANVWLEL